MDFFNWPPSWSTLLLLPGLFVAFTVHELAHALVAYLLGDTSQLERKRLSFNPLRHVSWLGMIAFLLVGLGWAKPVWVDHTRFRIKNRAFGMFLVSVAGATANLLTALLVVLGMSVTIGLSWMLGAGPTDALEFLMTAQPEPDLHGFAVALSYYMMTVNLLLALFNLLPIPPLDGFQALMSLMAMVRQGFRRGKGDEPTPPRAPAWTGLAPTERSPAQIHFDIGLDYHKEGQLDEAIARYRQATDQDAEYALAYYNLGLAYWAKGRPNRAASAFRAAARTADNVPLAVQVDQRLRELAQAERSSDQGAGPLPPPLELGAIVDSGGVAPRDLDPAVARRIWLRLATGGVAMLLLAISAWAFVTTVVLSYLVQA